MKKYCGGNIVPKGVYFCLNTYEFVRPSNYGIYALPGAAASNYVKVPAWLPVIAGPLFGLVFIMFLPLAGIIALFGFLAYKAGFASTNIGRKILYPLTVGFRGQAETHGEKQK